MILVTGGAGFIGSNFVLDWIATEGTPVVNLDKLTYAGNPANLAALKDNARHIFAHGDINDRALVAKLLHARLLERTGCRSAEKFPFSSCLDRRSLRFARHG